MRKNLYNFRVFQKGLTLKQFAEKAGVSQNTMVNIEKGHTKNLPTQSVIKLQKAFDLTPDEIHELLIIEQEEVL